MTDQARSAAVARTVDVPALIAGLITVTAWGSAFVAIRAAGHALPPGALALGRLVVSTAILSAVALVRREPLPPRRDLLLIGVYGIAWLGVYSTALNAAERLAGTVACLPFAPTLVTDAAKKGPAALGWTIYLGVVPTALGFATWAFALRRGTAGRTAALNYLIPVVAILLGWAVLAERPPWLAMGGGVLSLAGVHLARRGTVSRKRTA